MGTRNSTLQSTTHGHVDPLSPVAVARMKLSENPIWQQNRPGKWGRGKNVVYYGVFVLVIAVTLIAVFLSFSFGGLPARAVAILSFLLCPIQCLGTFFLLYGFDFLRARRGSLEEIALTGLGIADIAYGSYGAGAYAAGALVVPVAVAEIYMWNEVHWTAGLLALLLLPAFRWLLHCCALNYSLRRLTSAHPVDAVFLVSFPFLCIVQTGLCVFLGFFAIPTMAYLLGPRDLIGFVGVVFLLFGIVGYMMVIAWGSRTLTKGWHGAAENLYRRMEQ